MLKFRRVLALLLTAILLTAPFGCAEEAVIEAADEIEEIATPEPIEAPTSEPSGEPVPELTVEPTEEPTAEPIEAATEKPEVEEIPEAAEVPEIEETPEADVLPEDEIISEEELEEEESLIETFANELSGSLGSNLTWKLDSNGTLTISGTGAMPSMSSANWPWKNQRDDITSIVIKSGVTSIGDYVFDACASMTSVTIPSSVTSIGSYAFQSCISLKSVSIPDSVTSIGRRAFTSCTSLSRLSISKRVTSIGYGAFSFCESLTNVTIPNGVTSISDQAFCWCTSLTSVSIPNSVTKIGEAAFEGCTSLTSVTIPSSVTTIDAEAFSICESLTSVSVPNSVTSIGWQAFWGCKSMKSIYVLNKNCRIYDDSETLGLPQITTVYGSAGSTAQKYANDYGYKFVASSSSTNLSTPKLTSVTNTATGVKIAWNKVTGAARYRVYYRTGTSGSFKKLVNTSAGSYTWTGAKSGTKYNFTVRCLNSAGEVCSSYDSKGLTITYVAAPKLTSVSNAATGVKIAWGKVAGAARYRVYYRTGTSGSFKKLVNTSAGSYTWPDAKSGTTYNFTVRALNSAGEVCSSYDSKGVSVKYVAAPKLTSVSKVSTGIKIVWGKVTGASRYRVYYREGTSGAFKKLINTSAGSYTWTKAKSGTTYNFTVRCLDSTGAVVSSYDSKGKTITYKK